MMHATANILSAFDFERNNNWVDAFYQFNSAKFEILLKTKGEYFWRKAGEQRALRLFHAAAQRIPAYRDFLKKHRIRHETIKTIKDFDRIPLTDKKNYIQAYPLEKRCWNGAMRHARIIPASSGTSGEPAFWPRGGFQEFEAGVIHELIYKNIFKIDKRCTLALIGFPMGMYVSGVATVLPSWLVAGKYPSFTLMSVGNNKNEMLRAAKNLGKNYEQVLLIGHPFFIKDVVETGREQGISWKRMNVRMLFCSEGFSEAWRRYVMEEAGMAVSHDKIISTYGSSEMLLMAHETPLSILARNTLEQNSALRKKLFSAPTTPDLFQYNPLFRYIESIHNELVFTSASGIPLVRFNLRDSGSVVSFETIKKELKIGGAKDWKLPFVALWGRSDQTIVFYAANIYPEHIKAGLDDRRFYGKLTGKFVMSKNYLKNMDEFLEINIELTKGVKASKGLAQTIQRKVVEKLREINMEYLFLCNHLEKDLTPRIVLWPYQHEKHFRPGLKPKYILKNT